MKNILIATFNSILEVLKRSLFIQSEALYYLILALKLWCINLSIYFAAIVVIIFVAILKFDTGVFSDIGTLTRAYFYDGNFFGFLAYRVHLAFYFLCLIFTFRFIED